MLKDHFCNKIGGFHFRSDFRRCKLKLNAHISNYTKNYVFDFDIFKMKKTSDLLNQVRIFSFWKSVEIREKSSFKKVVETNFCKASKLRINQCFILSGFILLFFNRF
jgi:hypothetical protein